MINQFINNLASRESSVDMFNPYEDKNVANNLRAYLVYMLDNYKNGIMLVGEAPGHKGCKITGIPFTSGEVIRSDKHKIFKDIGKKINLSKEEKETTAKIVWDYLEGKSIIPLFWNAFPFHPHPEKNRNKNRQPNLGEVKEGLTYLKELIDIFKPRTIAGIGRFGTSCAQRAFTEKKVNYIRHPSYGGKNDFLDGIKKFI